MGVHLHRDPVQHVGRDVRVRAEWFGQVEEQHGATRLRTGFARTEVFVEFRTGFRANEERYAQRHGQEAG